MTSLQAHPVFHSSLSDSTPVSSPAPAPARASIPTGPASRHLIFDLGGDTCKIGWMGETSPRILSNSAVKSKRDTKWLVADQGITVGNGNTNTTTTTSQASHHQTHETTTARNNKPTSMSSAAAVAAAAASGKIMDYSGLYIRRAHDRVSRTQK